MESHAEELAVILHEVGLERAAILDQVETTPTAILSRLIFGSDIAMEDRGEHALNGIGGSWQIFAVSRPELGTPG
jgi:hypothetical protein